MRVTPPGWLRNDSLDGRALMKNLSVLISASAFLEFYRFHSRFFAEWKERRSPLAG